MKRSHTTILLLSAVLQDVTNGQWNGEKCFTEKLNVVKLERDPSTGTFRFVERYPPDFHDFGRGSVRMLQEIDLVQQDHSTNLRKRYNEFLPGVVPHLNDNLNSTRRRDEETVDPTVIIALGAAGNDTNAVPTILSGNASNSKIQTKDSQYFYARECDCFSPSFPTVYCPFTVTICRAPGWRSQLQQPGCITTPKGRELSKTIFQITVIWFSLLFSSLACTNYGKGVLHFGLSLCIPNWNHFVANRMMRCDPEQASRLIRTNVLRRRRRLERWIAQNQVENPTPAQNSANQRGAPSVKN